MSATNFKTENDTYRKLIGNGLTYHVPRFQRDYSWGEEEWDDLWQDIVNTVSDGGESAHYMGYLVLQTIDDKKFDIVDGQQRLTTLSLCVLAALKQLKGLISQGVDIERTQQRLEGLRQTYVGYLDPVTLVSRSKLTLNRNNDTYYQTYLVPLPEKLPQRGFKASEHSLRKAFEWFDKKLRDYVRGASDPGLEIAQLIDRMSDRLFFTVITVTDELNAYKVFETLNARGVRLSATDLLKNYLFSVLHREGRHEHELKSLDDRWEQIVGRLGAESFPDFLRVFWISSRSFVRQAELFKVIRSQIHDRSAVFTLITELENNMDNYLALVSPEVSHWGKKTKEYAQLLKMFSVKQPIPLLLAASRVLDENGFEMVLRALVSISFRYNVIGNLQTGEQERVYHAEAARISKGEHTRVQEILEGIKAVYPSDDSFKANFAEKSIVTKNSRNRRIVRYILNEIERQSGGLPIDIEDDKFNIEHVCPTNPEEGWDKFSTEEVEALTERIGNLVLLEEALNRQAANNQYVDKVPIYKQSNLLLVKKLVEDYEDWTPQKIALRQRSLAKSAVTVWKVAQYG
ncbi:hypothetical protein H4S14_001511 [Agrobacterium vitis]|nr:hypothetical protein [Agrobacterium vitis]MBE1437773.1 hypothetical protein [Agrobacterium vitis]